MYEKLNDKNRALDVYITGKPLISPFPHHLRFMIGANL